MLLVERRLRLAERRPAFLGSAAPKCGAPGEGFVQQHADGKHVGGRRERLTRELLGRHVPRRSEDLRVGSVAPAVGDRRSDPEVDELDRAFFVDQHVARSDVSVDHLCAAMRIVERAAYLHPQVRTFFGVERPCGREQVRERCSIAMLHRDVVHALFDPELVHRHDVWVTEFDRSFRLFYEAFDETLIGGELRPDLFDDQPLFESSRASQGCQVDSRHAAGGDLPL